MVKTHHIDTALLDKAIDSSGLKINFLCDALGITRQAFDKKRKGKAAFRLSEVFVLCYYLNLDAAQKNAIFFLIKFVYKQTREVKRSITDA